MEKSKPNFIIIGIILIAATVLGVFGGTAIFFFGRLFKTQVATPTNLNQPVSNKTPESNSKTPSDSAETIIDLTNPNAASMFGEGVTISTKSPYSDKPNPLLLLLKVDGQGNLKLNDEDIGNISSPHALTVAFREIFNNRELTKIMDKSVPVITPTKIRKEILTQLVQALKDAGAEKIVIHPRD